MKAFLIDPFEMKITEVEYTGDYRNIYDHIHCQTFTVVEIEEADAIFVDDEGLFVEGQAFFEYRGFPQPLAGRGLVLGTDDEGESIEPRITLAELKKNVKFGQLMRDSENGEIFLLGASADEIERDAS